MKTPTLKRYQRWLAAARQDGVALSGYRCPACNARLFTTRPPTLETRWDSTARCVRCEALLFKVAHCDGSVDVQLIEEQAR